jgi:DHA2 family multidrug resistance protein
MTLEIKGDAGFEQRGLVKPYGNPNFVVLAVGSAVAMEFFTTAAVNVVIPNMQSSFSATLDEISWVITVYLTCFTIVLPMVGWLLDHIGPRRYMAASNLVYVLASIGCGTSISLEQILVWRGIQGAAGACFLVGALNAIARVFPSKQRIGGFIFFAIVAALSRSVAPWVGGYVAYNWTWRWVFFLNIPFGLTSALSILLLLPPMPGISSRYRVDFVSFLLLAIGLGSLQTLLSRGQQDNWFASPLIRILTVMAVACLIAFIWWELSPGNQNPVISLPRLKNIKNYALGLTYTFALGIVLFSGLFILPLYLRNIQNRTSAQIGALLTISGLGFAAAIISSIALTNRIPRVLLPLAGMSAFTISMLMFAWRFTLETSDSALYLPLVLYGLGLGLQIPAVGTFTTSDLPQERLTEGTGLYLLVRQLGGSIGLALVTLLIDLRMTLYSSRLGESVNPYNPLLRQAISGIKGVFIARGIDPNTATEMAYKVAYIRLVQQSTIIAFIDVFYFLACVGIASILLLLILNRLKWKAPFQLQLHLFN